MPQERVRVAFAAVALPERVLEEDGDDRLRYVTIPCQLRRVVRDGLDDTGGVGHYQVERRIVSSRPRETPVERPEGTYRRSCRSIRRAGLRRTPRRFRPRRRSCRRRPSGHSRRPPASSAELSGSGCPRAASLPRTHRRRTCRLAHWTPTCHRGRSRPATRSARRPRRRRGRSRGRSGCSRGPWHRSARAPRLRSSRGSAPTCHRASASRQGRADRRRAPGPRLLSNRSSIRTMVGVERKVCAARAGEAGTDQDLRRVAGEPRQGFGTCSSPAVSR